MYIVIHNLYHVNNGHKAYFRKQGPGGFDFVNRKEFASNLTGQEALDIKKYEKWYCNQFGASHMTIEQMS